MPKIFKHALKPTELQITEPTGSPSPARRVVTRSPHRSVGLIACSWIQDEAIEYESQLERRFVQRTLLFPSLKRVLHQPFKIDYLEKEENRKYTPDFLLVFTDDTKLVVEVKPETYVKKHRTKLDAARHFLAAEGIGFIVATDEEIDAGVVPHNVSLLLRYARGAVADGIRERCLHHVHSATTPVTIGRLLVSLFGIKAPPVFGVMAPLRAADLRARTG